MYCMRVCIYTILRVQNYLVNLAISSVLIGQSRIQTLYKRFCNILEDFHPQNKDFRRGTIAVRWFFSSNTFQCLKYFPVCDSLLQYTQFYLPVLIP